MSIDEFLEKAKRIGEGRYSEIYLLPKEQHSHVLADASFTGRIVAKKYYEGFEESMKREVNILKDLHHPNIVRYLTSVVALNPCILLEYVPGMNLLELIQTQPNLLGKSLYIGIAKQLADVLVYLHSNKIIHHDFKPHNILIDTTDWRVVLCDFGNSINASVEIPVNGIGKNTLIYCAPELLGSTSRPYDEKIDIYGLGATLWTMLSGHEPFRHVQASYQVIIYIQKGQGFEMPANFLNGELCPVTLSRLVQSCIAVNPQYRPLAKSVVNSISEISCT